MKWKKFYYTWTQNFFLQNVKLTSKFWSLLLHELGESVCT